VIEKDYQRLICMAEKFRDNNKQVLKSELIKLK